MRHLVNKLLTQMRKVQMKNEYRVLKFSVASVAPPTLFVHNWKHFRHLSISALSA